MPVTSMPSVAPGDTITSAGWNVITANISLLDGRTGGDPGGSSKFLTGSGTLAAVWTAFTSLIGNITTTGIVTALGFQAGASGVNGGAGGINASTGGYAGGTTSVGVPSVLGLNVGASGIAVGAAGVNSSGPIQGTTGTFSGAVSTGSITPTSYAGGSTSTGSPSVLGMNVGTSGISLTGVGAIANATAVGTGTLTASGAISALSAAITNGITAATATMTGLCKALTFESTVSTGTAPLVVASTTKVTNLNADQLDGLDSTGFARLAAASDFSTAPTINSGVIWHSGNDGAGSGLDADTLDTLSSTAFARLGAASDFSTAPTINGDQIPVVKYGSYTGNGASARQITTGFLCKYVRIQATNGSASAMFELINVALEKNLKITGTTTASITQMLDTVLHGSDGFVVDGGTDTSNTNSQVYYYAAWG